MAEVDAQCSEMAEAEPHPADLWESAYTNYEDYVAKKQFPPDSIYYEVASEIRGTFHLIINYHTAYPELAKSNEAREITQNALRGLEQIRSEHTEVHTFFPALLQGLKQIAMEVHTAFFITYNANDNSFPALQPYKEPKSTLDTENLAKRRKVSSLSKPSRASKREATAPLIKTQNKFAFLANISETEGATASSSAATPAHEQQPIPSVMETNESGNVTVTERTAPKKEPRPPPVTVLGHNGMFKINKELKSQLEGDLKVVNTAEGLRYYSTTN